METLVDAWLAAHPDHPALPHAEAEPADDAAIRATSAVDDAKPDEAAPAAENPDDAAPTGDRPTPTTAGTSGAGDGSGPPG